MINVDKLMYFISVFHFHTPEDFHTKGFLTLSWGMEVEHWAKMSQLEVQWS